MAQDVTMGLWEYEMTDWTKEAVFVLVLTARDKIEIPDRELAQIIRGMTNLTNPILEREMTRSDIMRKAKKLKYYKDYDVGEPEERPTIAQIPTTDEGWLEIFPARTKGDLSVRRMRMADVAEKKTLEQLNKYRNLDYIHVMNLLLAEEIYGQEIVDVWKEMDMLRSLDHFIRGANSLNQVSHLC